MLTNTYTPHVGGVARSVKTFSEEYRKRGHRVLVVAPTFPDMPKNEIDVVRIPAIQQFNASDFSIALPIPGLLTDALDRFQPDIVHAHHPFLLGMTALRVARYRHLPLVFTHHTLYEQYTHYVPGDSPILKHFVIELATRYANLSDQVFAPSESIQDLLQKRGVTQPIAVISTGVKLDHFMTGDGALLRRQLHIPEEAFVVGHVGRLAPEKNLEFLAEAVAAFLKTHHCACFLVVGAGPSEPVIHQVFSRQGLDKRLYFTGVLEASQLANALHAMDLFAFSSKSETQGMVLTEAMAAGLPVVALDATGVREVVKDRKNGRLIKEETIDVFAAGLQWAADQPTDRLQALKHSALETAEVFSLPNTADKTLSCYQMLLQPRASSALSVSVADKHWEDILELIKAEWDILINIAGAANIAFDYDKDPPRIPS